MSEQPVTRQDVQEIVEKAIAPLLKRQRKQSATLKKHGTTLDEHGVRLDKHGATLDEHTAILNEHTAILNEHTAILNEHSAILKDHTAALQRIERQQDQTSRDLRDIRTETAADREAQRQFNDLMMTRLDHIIRIVERGDQERLLTHEQLADHEERLQRLEGQR